MSNDAVTPRTADDLLAELRQKIQRLYRHGGEPSTRAIAAKLSQAVSHTTVNAVLKCKRLPRWGQLELVIEAIGGDPEVLRPLWISIRDAEDIAADGIERVESAEAGFDGELEVVKDHATLRYDDGIYLLNQKRLIRNVGQGDINGYLVRVHVDRFPHFAKLSELYHLQHPIRSGDLNFAAWRGLRRRVPLSWVRNAATSSVVERWLQFTGDGQPAAPLKRGEETWIEYEYEVSRDRWGDWFQRAIKHKTAEVQVTIDFPIAVIADPERIQVLVTSTDDRPGEYRPAKVPRRASSGNGRTILTWKVLRPALHSRYRTVWAFPNWPTTRLGEVGVIQYRDGDDALTRKAEPVDFAVPSAAAEVEAIATQLAATADAIEGVHRFTGTMGLAAPQIGIGRQVVLIRNGHDDFLVNPVIVASSGHVRDVEGCLSLFDVRAELTRAERIDVEYRDLDGEQRRRTYTGRNARDVAHEIDHLSGTLFVDRMSPTDPITLMPDLRSPDSG